MAGIYLHIPFCKQACHYCNFHFSTSLRQKDAMLAAILKEIELSKNYLHDETIETVYFGGGTPSLLEADEIQAIFDKINKYYAIEKHAEVTLEANPDDLSSEKINAFKQTPINRFSIGIQSFFEADLKYMNRAHNAEEALTCVKKTQDAGFHNLTLDLIYGTPTMTNEQWSKNIDIVFDLAVPHVSCYCLTVEPKTALDKLVKKGKALAVNDEQAIWQFETLMSRMQTQGFDHYEISNFGKPNFYAQHNSNYWRGAKYLGLGPSAHSFDGTNRRFNIANNSLYIKGIEDNTIPFEEEILTHTQQYNEYVMISLRTIWGTDINKVKKFGDSYFNFFNKKINEFIIQELVVQQNNIILLTQKGKLMADFIAMELFF
jgi:oxygen-independent coproporphyrinogen III oxidase